MSLEHQMAAKVANPTTIHENAMKAVKVGDQVTYVNESGIGREAHVKAISGETATLEVILPDGQLVEKSGVKYVSLPEKREGGAAPTAEAAAKHRKGGRRGKAKTGEKLSEDGRPLDANGNPVARDIVKFHDTAIVMEDQDGEYWHV